MKSVLITGAGKNFGRELMRVYSKRGWRLFPLVRKDEYIDSLLNEFPSDCYPIRGDVSTDDVIGAIQADLAKHTDGLDLLINNAGIIYKNRGISMTTSDELTEHFNVHCVGSWRCATAALPFLKKAARPMVVNITSRKGSIGRTPSATGDLIYAYQIAKAAQNMLSALMYQELKDSRIAVFSVHPGNLKTSVAPPDADTDPYEAAMTLAAWLDEDDYTHVFGCYDIINGTTIEW